MTKIRIFSQLKTRPKTYYGKPANTGIHCLAVKREFSVSKEKLLFHLTGTKVSAGETSAELLPNSWAQ